MSNINIAGVADAPQTKSPILAKMEDLKKQQHHQQDLIFGLRNRLEIVTIPITDDRSTKGGVPSPEKPEPTSDMEMKIVDLDFITRENNRMLEDILNRLRL